MTGVEIIGELTDIISRQAVIIRELHNITEQLDAVTTLDDEVERLLSDYKSATQK